MLAFNLVNWLQTHQLPCPFKSLLGVDCPGCGLQRSAAELLKGNLRASLELHPATIPLILFFLFSGVHLVKPVKWGNNIIVYGYVFVVVVTFTNYIYKSIHLL